MASGGHGRICPFPDSSLFAHIVMILEGAVPSRHSRPCLRCATNRQYYSKEFQCFVHYDNVAVEAITN